MNIVPNPRVTKLQSIFIIFICIGIIAFGINTMIAYSNESRPSASLFENSQTVALINEINIIVK